MKGMKKTTAKVTTKKTATNVAPKLVVKGATTLKSKLRLKTLTKQVTAYTTEQNSKWLDGVAKKSKTTRSATINAIFTNLRKNFKGSKMDELIIQK